GCHSNHDARCRSAPCGRSTSAENGIRCNAARRKVCRFPPPDLLNRAAHLRPSPAPLHFPPRCRFRDVSVRPEESNQSHGNTPPRLADYQSAVPVSRVETLSPAHLFFQWEEPFQVSSPPAIAVLLCKIISQLVCSPDTAPPDSKSCPATS